MHMFSRIISHRVVETNLFCETISSSSFLRSISSFVIDHYSYSSVG